MSRRMNYKDISPEVFNLLIKSEEYMKDSTLDKKLLELVKIRASQINGCAFCLNMHTEDARAIGETERRIYLLNAWRETVLYTSAERVALEFTEVLTQISLGHVSDELFEKMKELFTEKEIVDLVFAINNINNWNRLNIALA
ncbi:MAG: carboxymuconolactone decarboxylase family protein [Gudongella sp.]|jgi:AhpD family alkylhydroperoxidase|nr:carboxymuconolactone decarboxylase family protein [Gudongella sp.]